MDASRHEVSICDAHHHLWDRRGLAYDADDLRADLATRGDQVTGTVFVECGAWYHTSGPEHLRPIGETAWVVEHAGDVVRGIVGFADLRLGDAVVEVLEAHTAAGDGRFRGIRHRAAWDPSPEIRPGDPDPGPGLLGDPRFRRGFAALVRGGLTFDAWIYFPQLPEVTELARAFPDASIVLDHLGGPICLGPYAGRRAEVLALWRPLITDVAACPNVVVKLGGIGMPMYGFDWHRHPLGPTADQIATAWRDEVRFCIDAFGVERCMFESNFPVDKVSMRYTTLWDAFAMMTDDLGPAERAALFHGTAESVYRL